MSDDVSDSGPDHPAWSVAALGTGVSAGAAVLFLLLRLIAVSDGDWRTASAVADTVDFGDAISMIFGSLMANPIFSSLLVMVLLPVAIIAVVWPADRSPQWQLTPALFVAALAAAFVTLLATYHAWWFPVGAVLVAVAVVGARLLWRRGVGNRIVRTVIKGVGVIALIGVLLIAAFGRDPWTSEELITTRSGHIDGYVLASESGFVKVLTAKNRRFVIVNTDDIRSRKVLGG